jgi:hypothetical protein
MIGILSHGILKAVEEKEKLLNRYPYRFLNLRLAKSSTKKILKVSGKR